MVVIDMNLGPRMAGERFVADTRRREVRPARVVVLSGVRRVYEVARAMRTFGNDPEALRLRGF